MASRLELWKADGTVVVLPDPVAHGAPSHAQVQELVQCKDVGTDSWRLVKEKTRVWVAYPNDPDGSTPVNKLASERLAVELIGDLVVSPNASDLKWATAGEDDDG